MPQVQRLFVGGGGDDWFSNIVKNYEAEYRRSNPTFHCRYFSWSDGTELMAELLRAPRDASIAVVGHSYGADTSFSAIISAPRAVNLLISIDPVGRIRPSWAAIAAQAATWLNVRAEPSAARRTLDDTIAAIGGKYPRPPAPGQAGAPNYSLAVDATHGDFRAMMRAATNGVSGRSLLGGTGVG